MMKFKVGQRIYCACDTCVEEGDIDVKEIQFYNEILNFYEFTDLTIEYSNFAETYYKIDENWEKIRQTELYKIMQEVEND